MNNTGITFNSEASSLLRQTTSKEQKKLKIGIISDLRALRSG